MVKRSPVAIFMAATALIASGSLQANLVNAGEKSLGGLKEWTTDQGIDEESSLDKEAKAAKEKAKEEDICIPIGEGENCW
ncbi:MULTISPECIES: hypothetical protein [Prochlorococcus]|uniref:hypothetical protein n=1 Tax=Prochlorococcus TaxID=1218 RepID=UPI00056BFB1F|nr:MULTISPECIES: hypothetical protein [Prochlorococcus]